MPIVAFTYPFEQMIIKLNESKQIFNVSGINSHYVDSILQA